MFSTLREKIREAREVRRILAEQDRWDSLTDEQREYEWFLAQVSEAMRREAGS